MDRVPRRHTGTITRISFWYYTVPRRFTSLRQAAPPSYTEPRAKIGRRPNQLQQHTSSIASLLWSPEMFCLFHLGGGTTSRRQVVVQWLTSGFIAQTVSGVGNRSSPSTQFGIASHYVPSFSYFLRSSGHKIIRSRNWRAAILRFSNGTTTTF